MLNLGKSNKQKNRGERKKNPIKNIATKAKIRDAETDEFAVGLLEREYIFNGYFLLACFGIGFSVGVFSIILFMMFFI